MLNSIIDIHLSIEITQGCTFDVINATILEEETRKEVVVEIVRVLESIGFPNITAVFTTLPSEVPVDSGETGSGNATKSPLKAVYEDLAKKFEVETSENGYNNFAEAVSQIIDAKVAACEDGHNLDDMDFHELVDEYEVLKDDYVENIVQLRDIFGKMMCLSEKEHVERKRKRRDFHCIDRACQKIKVHVCEFFACLDPEDDIKPLMGFLNIVVDEHAYGFPCLAFTVDTTGSMSAEIHAVKEVIRAFLLAEEHGPGCYILQPFNDNADGYFDPTST